MPRQRGKSWVANVRLSDGRRLRPTFSTKVEAAAWEATAKLALAKGLPIPHSDLGASLASRLRGLHLLLGSLQNLTPSSQGSARAFDHVSRTEWSGMKSGSTLIRNGGYVVDYFGRSKPLPEITSADIASMKVHFGDKGYSKATVNRFCAALSKFFRVAKEAGAIDNRPTIKWNAEVKTRFRYLDEVEERVVLAFWLAQRWGRRPRPHHVPDRHGRAVLDGSHACSLDGLRPSDEQRHLLAHQDGQASNRAAHQAVAGRDDPPPEAIPAQRRAVHRHEQCHHGEPLGPHAGNHGSPRCDPAHHAPHLLHPAGARGPWTSSASWNGWATRPS